MIEITGGFEHLGLAQISCVSPTIHWANFVLFYFLAVLYSGFDPFYFATITKDLQLTLFIWLCYLLRPDSCREIIMLGIPKKEGWISPAPGSVTIL